MPAAFGNILTDSPATWASDDVTLANKIDNVLQSPPPVSADARERVIAKQLNTYCKALNDLVDFLQGVAPAGDVTTIAQLLGGLSVNGSPIQSGTGSPEGVVTSTPGGLWLRTDGGAGEALYTKESGAAEAGWVLVVVGGGGATEPVSNVAKFDVGGTTLSLVMGERGLVDAFAVASAFTLSLPEITLAVANGGKRCSLVVPTGNPGRDIIVEAFSGDGVMDASTGTFVASVTFTAGDLSGYNVLNYEAVRGGGGAGLPSTLLSISPSQVNLPAPGVESFTLSGTGGTLPAAVDIDITLATQGGPQASPLTTGAGQVSVTGATQGGGPDTAWTIDFDISAGLFTVGFTIFDIDVFDSSGGPPAAFGSAVDVIGLNNDPSPLTDTGGNLSHIWVLDNSAESGPSGGSYESTLAAGQDSGVLGRYLNAGSRAVIGSTLADSPDPGSFTDGAEIYRYEGSHTSTPASSGDESGGTYVLDAVDILENLGTGLFSGTAVIEWEAFRYASTGGNPPTLRGYGAAKETWTVGSSTTQNTSIYSDVSQFSGFDVIRLAVGSSLRSIAFDVLDSPEVETMFVKFFYRITYANNVNTF